MKTFKLLLLTVGLTAGITNIAEGMFPPNKRHPQLQAVLAQENPGNQRLEMRPEWYTYVMETIRIKSSINTLIPPTRTTPLSPQEVTQGLAHLTELDSCLNQLQAKFANISDLRISTELQMHDNYLEKFMRFIREYGIQAKLIDFDAALARFITISNSKQRYQAIVQFLDAAPIVPAICLPVEPICALCNNEDDEEQSPWVGFTCGDYCHLRCLKTYLCQEQLNTGLIQKG